MERRRFLSLLAALPALSITGAARATAPAAPSGTVRIDGSRLTLDGERFRFIGLNVYSLLSRPEERGFQCGNAFTDAQVREVLDEVRAMGANVVRIQAYRSHLEGRDHVGVRDHSRLDLVVREAERRGLKLLVALENQWWDCTRGGYRFSDWYARGYREREGGFALSYREHVADVTARYRDSPAILAWQLLNEAESKTPQGAEDPEPLIAFVDDMVTLAKTHDPNHIVHLGTIGVERPGSGGAFYALLHTGVGGRAASEMFEAHDYDPARVPERIELARLTAKLVGKPFFIGEMNVPSLAGENSQVRADAVFVKMVSAWALDVDGVVLWSYRSDGSGGHDFGPNDPLVAKIAYFTRHHLGKR